MAVALPPLERWSVEALVQAASRRSGFSAVTDLNAVGPLTLSRTIVMRVDAPEPPPPMRGAVYDRYVTGRWLSSRRAFVAEGQRAPGAVDGATEYAGTVVEAEDDVLAILFGPLGLQGVRAWDGDGCDLPVRWDGHGVPRAPGAARWEWDAVPSTAEAWPPTLTDLRLPDNVTDEFRRLAASAAPASATTVEVVAGVAALFDQGYVYSLDRPPPPPGADPVCDFAVRSRQGHCELFASATVLLLRCRGVPARYVTGFHCHERNPLTGRWIVRERNAHAWVEVWMPRRGWQSLDTTPPGSAEPPEGSPALAWVEYGVAWVMRGIRRLVSVLRRFELSALLRWARELVTGLLRTARGLAVLAAVGLLLLGLVLRRLLRRRREDAGGGGALTADQLRARRVLTALEGAWAARGLARRPWETAAELRDRCRERGGDDAALVALTEEVVARFEEVRYGGGELAPDEADGLVARLTSR